MIRDHSVGSLAASADQCGKTILAERRHVVDCDFHIVIDRLLEHRFEFVHLIGLQPIVILLAMAELDVDPLRLVGEEEFEHQTLPHELLFLRCVRIEREAKVE